MMEADPATKQTVGSLLGIARLRPNVVIQALASALETLAKVSGTWCDCGIWDERMFGQNGIREERGRVSITVNQN